MLLKKCFCKSHLPQINIIADIYSMPLVSKLPKLRENLNQFSSYHTKFSQFAKFKGFLENFQNSHLFRLYCQRGNFFIQNLYLSTYNFRRRKFLTQSFPFQRKFRSKVNCELGYKKKNKQNLVNFHPPSKIQPTIGTFKLQSF